MIINFTNFSKFMIIQWKLHVARRNTVSLAKINLKKKKSNEQSKAHSCTFLPLHSSSFYAHELRISVQGKEERRKRNSKSKEIVNLNSAETEYPNNCQMYKKAVLLTRCYQAQENTEERPHHDELLCFDRSDL